MKYLLSLINRTAKLAALLSFFTVSAFSVADSELKKEINPILVSEAIPEVTLLSNKGETVNLHKLVGQAPTLFVFYRGGWCPYCNTHLSDLRKIEGDLAEMGIQIVAISPDKVENLTETVDKNELSYTLLSDTKMQASKAFGLAYTVDAETMKKLKGYGIDIEKSSGESHGMLPVPAAILVDKDLIVHFVHAAPNYKVRVDKDVVLAAAKAMSKG